MEAPSTAMLERAAGWIVQLNDASVTEKDFLQWQSWLAEQPLHARAFHDMQEIWRRSASVSQDSTAAGPAMQAMRAEVDALLEGSRRKRIVAVRWGALAAAAIVAVLGVFLWQNDASVVQTATAELRSVRLPDGSRAALGPETQIKIDFADNVRSLTMLAGEAYFEVAHSTERPFSVSTAAGRVVAVGTAFSVHATEDRVVVSVTEGIVRIEPAQGAGPTVPVMVSAGQRYLHDRATAQVEPLASVADAVAWRDSRLEYQGEPLRVVVSDINRYSSTKLTIADPALGELRYTGTVFPDALDAWAASIEGVFPVRIEVVDGKRQIVRAPGSHPSTP